MSSYLSQLDPAEYLLTFLKNDIRPDGRPFSQSRPVSLRRGTISAGVQGCCGSAQAQIGNTIVTCGVNLMVGTTSHEQPNSGDIVFDVTLKASCSMKYDQKSKTDDAYELESFLQAVIVRGKIVDLEQLCLIEGRTALRLCVNVTCVSAAGNLRDAVLLAAIGALSNVVLPEYEIDNEVEVKFTSRQGKHLVLSCQPYSITVGYCRKGYDKLDMQIYLVDPSNEEENSVDGILKLYTCEAVDIEDHKSSPMCGIGASSTNKTKDNTIGTLTAQQLKVVCQACQQQAVKMHTEIVERER